MLVLNFNLIGWRRGDGHRQVGRLAGLVEGLQRREGGIRAQGVCDGSAEEETEERGLIALLLGGGGQLQCQGGYTVLLGESLHSSCLTQRITRHYNVTSVHICLVVN